MESSPPVPTVAPSPPLADFGDWLSPMIVKELRQGLRSWIFVGAFIILQAILVMTLLISSSAGNVEASTYMFWMLIAAILVFIVPLRGFNAMAGEIKTETLDLLMLTRLGAFRIATGKWIALVAQSTLIAISVLPYVVLRYFGGGVDLVGEMIALLLLWMLSAAVTAAAVSFSALPSIILRTIILLGTYFVAAIATNLAVMVSVSRFERGFLSGMWGDPSDMWKLLVVIVPLWAYGCYFLLDVGATAIAPLAANHATRKRLISLAMLTAILALVHYLPASSQEQITAMMCLMAIAGLAAFDCLTEAPTTSPAVYAPFLRRGLPGRIAACFFAPGWITGLAFYCLLVVLVLGALQSRISLGTTWHVGHTKWITLVVSNCLLAPLVPLALSLMVFPRHPRPLGPYIVCTLVLVIISLLFLIMVELSNADTMRFIGVLSPVTALMLFETDYVYYGSNEFWHSPGSIILSGGLISGGVFLLYLLWKAFVIARADRAAMSMAGGISRKPGPRESAAPQA